MKIENPEYVYLDKGYPGLSMLIDGKRFWTDPEQKLLRKFGIVTLDGPDDFSEYKATVPADPDDGRPKPLVVRCATDNPLLVALVRQFWNDANSGSFGPGPVSLPHAVG